MALNSDWILLFKCGYIHPPLITKNQHGTLKNHKTLPPVGRLWPSDDDDGDHGDGDDDREKFARSQDATLSRFENLKFRGFFWEPGPSQWSAEA